jgi:hypothetical protein
MIDHYDTIKQVFDDVTKDVVVDLKLVQRIHEYERAFVNRNEDHLAFFGGNLMGVKPMRFRQADRDNWFADVLQIDELSLEDGIHSLKSLDPEWKRANDVMNLSCIWAVYALLQSPKLSPQAKHEACVDVMLVLQYKFLGSLMAHFFRYPADEQVMLAVYRELNYKYALKAAGSWNVLLRNRAEEIMSPKSIHHRTYQVLGDDKAIVYMVSDIQGRLREIVKKMTTVFYQLRAKGVRIGTDKSFMDIDGSAVVKDKTRHYSSYIRYMHTVLDDKGSLIREELTNVIADAMKTMPPRLLDETLEWMHLNHRAPGHHEIEELVNETLVFAFDYIATDREILGKRSGITPLLIKLRALYMASRMSDPSLLKSKALAEKIVGQAVKTKNASVIASVRTGLQMYLVVRSLAMHHYAS